MLTQRETNYYIARCASSPEQLVIDLFGLHQRFAVCCPYIAVAITEHKNQEEFQKRICLNILSL